MQKQTLYFVAVCIFLLLSGCLEKPNETPSTSPATETSKAEPPPTSKLVIKVPKASPIKPPESVSGEAASRVEKERQLKLQQMQEMSKLQQQMQKLSKLQQEEKIVHGKKSRTAKGNAELKAAMEKHASNSELPEKFMNIQAVLKATSKIKVPGPPGDLRVWIGDTQHSAPFSADMTSASAVIPTSVKPQTVKVSPIAPGFTVEPQSICESFDPTGTTVNFTLTPKYHKNDKYRVGASVALYREAGCKGDPTPKEAKDIFVEVSVSVIPTNIPDMIRDNLGKLISGLLAILVAVILFKVRKFFGLKGQDDNPN